jgi:5-methylcytosine-specific restriction endonuclease McrA
MRAYYPAIASGTKACRICGEVKAVVAFHANGYYRDGRESRCMTCANRLSRPSNRRATLRYATTHAAQRLAQGNAWRRRNRIHVETLRQERRFGGNYLFVLRRDLARCADCQRAEQLVVHHIDGRSYHNSAEPNNDPANLVTLCRSCHSKRHVLELGLPHERVPGRSRRLAS